MAGKLTIAFIKKEAELYRSHGLYREARSIYRRLLKMAVNLDAKTKKAIKQKIRLIEQEIIEFDEASPKLPTPKEVSFIKEGWPEEETLSDVKNSFLVFLELGLFEEARIELSKLLKQDVEPTDLIPDLVRCLLEIHSGSDPLQWVDKFLYGGREFARESAAEFKFAFAGELERRNSPDLALAMYRSLKATDPDYPELDLKLNTLTAERSLGARLMALSDRLLGAFFKTGKRL
jgi:tetratricopeptide (TPR) repeat protein